MNYHWLRTSFMVCMGIGVYNLIGKRYQEALGSLCAFGLIVAVEWVISLTHKKKTNG